MEGEKEKLTFRGLLIEGIKKFAGEIIGVLLIACFLWAFPGFRSLFTDHTFPAKDESNEKIQRELEIHKQEEERLKAELKQKEEALRQAEAQKQEEAKRRAEIQKQNETQKPKHPAMSDKDFVELCKSGNARKVEEAIMNGANVNAKDNYGATASALYGHTETVELLLKHGADVNAKTDGRWTALMETTLLIGNYNETALMMAALNGHTETVELLLKYGADVRAEDNLGATALMRAKGGGHTDIANILRRYGAKQ